MYYKISQLVAFTSFTLICLVHLVSLENKFPDLSLFVGETVHLGFDALLFSAFLAGVKRTTGLTPSLSQVPNKDIRQLLCSYLELGEYAFDFAVVIFGRSSSFERKR